MKRICQSTVFTSEWNSRKLWWSMFASINQLIEPLSLNRKQHKKRKKTLHNMINEWNYTRIKTHTHTHTNLHVYVVNIIHFMSLAQNKACFQYKQTFTRSLRSNITNAEVSATCEGSILCGNHCRLTSIHKS